MHFVKYISIGQSVVSEEQQARPIDKTSRNIATNPHASKAKSKVKKVGTAIKKKTYHPMGLSINDVKAKGAVPACKYCLQKIKRGHWHTVQRMKRNNEKHASTHHYHFDCSRKFLSTTDRMQLVTIVRASTEMDEELKDLFASDIGSG